MTDCDKVVLRQYYRDLRQKFPIALQVAASKAIVDRLEALTCFQQAEHIALYYPCNNEVNLLALQRAENYGKQFYFPSITAEKKLVFLPVNTQTPFKKHTWGLYEPAVPLDSAHDANTLDLIIMPLVAFDANCNRIGMGGGYYDRTLAKNNSLLVGVAFNLQYTHHIEPDSWDISPSIIITETNIYRKLAIQ